MELLPEGPVQHVERSLKSYTTARGIPMFEVSVMSSSKQSDCNWLLVESKNGGRYVVSFKSVVNPLNKELRPGDVITVNRRVEQKTAKVVALAGNRDVLDEMIKKLKREEEAGPSMKTEEEAEDFSSSSSSWVPSDDHGAQSEDSAEVEIKKVKLEKGKRQYSNRRSDKKIITPSLRATPVVPKMMQQSKIKTMMTRKRAHNESLDLSRNISINKSLPSDSTRIKNLQNGTGKEDAAIEVRNRKNIKKKFRDLFKILDNLKQATSSPLSQSSREPVPFPLKVEDMRKTPYNQTIHDDVREIQEANTKNEEFNRSNDHVLITNKHNNVAVKTAQNKGAEIDEWVPIGSGKTFIHRDKFKRVNWKSYTIATRTLLLALFPRRVLATHSLTGKRSPAFQDKPAKMCLDPKKISDVIIEVMERFKVRENLVRTIITTKCADECKMWKNRVNKKKAKNNNENIPPPGPSPNNHLEEQQVIYNQLP